MAHLPRKVPDVYVLTVKVLQLVGLPGMQTVVGQNHQAVSVKSSHEAIKPATHARGVDES
jgi:hypothetical protein